MQSLLFFLLLLFTLRLKAERVTVMENKTLEQLRDEYIGQAEKLTEQIKQLEKDLKSETSQSKRVSLQHRIINLEAMRFDVNSTAKEIQAHLNSDDKKYINHYGKQRSNEKHYK